jgi:AbrB family looped-hinge helix DNA binding protein
MKNTGIVRKLDELGRITLPIELRRNLGIEEGERAPLEIFVDEDRIVLKKHEPEKDCEKAHQIELVNGKYTCKNCGKVFKEAN